MAQPWLAGLNTVYCSTHARLLSRWCTPEPYAHMHAQKTPHPRAWPRTICPAHKFKHGPHRIVPLWAYTLTKHGKCEPL